MERHRTDKRFWSWHVSIVLLIIVFLIALVVLFKRALTTETEKIEERKEMVESGGRFGAIPEIHIIQKRPTLRTSSKPGFVI